MNTTQIEHPRGTLFCKTREAGRRTAARTKRPLKDNGKDAPKGERWTVNIFDQKKD